MEASLNVKLMGVVAIFLAAIKFALLPVIDWQNQMIDEIYQVERRNIKAENLLSNQDQIFMKLATLDGGYKQKADIYPVFADQASFRLETQILFEMLLKQYDLRQTQFFWRDSEDINAFGNLHKAKFNVNFHGKLKDFTLLQSALLSVNKQYKIANMSLNTRSQTDKSFGFVKAAITVEAFYWLGGKR